MSHQLTVDDARQSLQAHAAAKGHEIREKYGPVIGWNALQKIFQDRTCVRYPCEILFEATPLQPGEAACTVIRGERPEAGFALHLHPLCLTRLDEIATLVLYHLVVVNYGDFASPEDAEAFGAAALGLSTEDYYQRVCALTDEITTTQLID